MTETLSATTARNFVGGTWSEACRARRYEKRNPWRPSEVTGVFAASTAADARGAVEAAACRFPGLGGAPRAGAGGVPLPGRRRSRGPCRADRAGHDRRDGEAAARSPDGGGTGSDDPPLSRRARRIGRPARCTSLGRPPEPLHEETAARRRGPDHTVELPDRDPGLEARARAHLREHRRAQARLRGASHRPPHRGVLRGGRAAGRGAQRPDRGGLEGRGASSSRIATSAPSRSPARSRSAVRCATRRPPATAACSSSSAARTRSS